MFLSRGDRDLGVAFQTHPGRQAFISSGSKEPRSALESPEGWYGEGGWRGVQDGEHVYTSGGFMLIYGKTNKIL